MSRVERAMDQPNNAFGLFEVAISLDKTVRRRTAELQAALRSVERTNEALLKAKKQAEQANAFKSTFLAFVSHDLLQPLNAARLNISTLMETNPDPAIARFVHQIDLALTNLEELIRTLLDISKLDAGVDATRNRRRRAGTRAFSVAPGIRAARSVEGLEADCAADTRLCSHRSADAAAHPAKPR